MKLNAFINIYYPSSLLDYWIFDSLKRFMNQFQIGEFEVENSIISIVQSCCYERDISTTDIICFKEKLRALPQAVQDVFVLVLFALCLKTFKIYLSDINSAIDEVENNICAGKIFLYSNNNCAMQCYSLLNLFRITYDFSASINEFFWLPIVESDIIYTRVPLAINVFRLVGKLPSTGFYHELDLSKPFYPTKLQLNANKISLRKGIKNSDHYFPYKVIKKIGFSENENEAHRNFAATDGRKIFFIRGISVKIPNSVLASKIATIISREHFSSERLLDNYLVASKKLDQFVASICEPTIERERKKLNSDGRHYYPGTGVVEEVLRFIYEKDLSGGNFGVSARNLLGSHLVKIDFADCLLEKHIGADEYESKLLSGFSFFKKNILSQTKATAVINMQHKEGGLSYREACELLNDHSGYILYGKNLFGVDVNQSYSYLIDQDVIYNNLCTVIRQYEVGKLEILSDEEVERISTLTDRKLSKFNQFYFEEKIITRLKLSLLTPNLISALADKSYTIEEEKDNDVQELNSRNKIVTDSLHALFNAESPKSILKITLVNLFFKQPSVINDLTNDIISYVDKHFAGEVHDDIVSSIKEKSQMLSNLLSSKDKSLEAAEALSAQKKSRFCC